MQLSQKTKDKDLKEFFSVVGDVRSVKMIQDRHSRRPKAIGIAYIEFKYSQSVPLALGLNGQQVNGIPIIVQQSQAEKNRHAQMVESAKQTLSKLGNGPIKLKVTNLIDEITEEMFRTIFEPFGRLDSVELIDDPITGKSAGSGFVTFSDCDAGKTAHKELDRFDLGGKRIRVSGTALPLFL
jgi:RNA-binding protein 39